MSNKTFWPIGILLSLFGIVLACVATIVFASNYPVYEDDFYFEKYQNVESNFNEIQVKQRLFDENFKLFITNKKELINKKRKQFAFVIENEKFELFIEKLGEFEAKDLNISARLTRPHTNKEDKVLVFKDLNPNLKTRILSFDLTGLKKGRYQVKIKAQNSEFVGFKNYEILVK